MSYIDDFIADNAGRLTCDEMTTSLRGAGYDDKEIKAALRRGPRLQAAAAATAPASWMTATSVPQGPMEPIDRAALDYIRSNQGRYSRQAVTGALRDAGYDRATIDAAWARLGRSAPTPSAAPIPSQSGAGWLGRNWVRLLAVAAIGGTWLLANAGLAPEGLFTVVFLAGVGALAVWRMLNRGSG